MGNERRILFFTMHKSASMFVHRVCADLARATNLTYYSPNGGDVRVNLKEIATNGEFWLNHTSGCFGPLRVFVKVPGIDDDRILLHLRDPRDVLVSMFYSYCYSHTGEIAGGTGYRKSVAEDGIDDFVVKLASARQPPVRGDYGTGAHLWDLAGNVQQRYSDYVQHLLKKPHLNVVLVRYEEMIADLFGWLTKVAGQFGIDDRETIERLVKKYRPSFHRGEENEWVHMRKATPGDYLEKLRPTTIARLDRIFEEILQCLGYEQSEPR